MRRRRRLQSGSINDPFPTDGELLEHTEAELTKHEDASHYATDTDTDTDRDGSGSGSVDLADVPLTAEELAQHVQDNKETDTMDSMKPHYNPKMQVHDLDGPAHDLSPPDSMPKMELRRRLKNWRDGDPLPSDDELDAMHKTASDGSGGGGGSGSGDISYAGNNLDSEGTFLNSGGSGSGDENAMDSQGKDYDQGAGESKELRRRLKNDVAEAADDEEEDHGTGHDETSDEHNPDGHKGEVTRADEEADGDGSGSGAAADLAEGHADLAGGEEGDGSGSGGYSKEEMDEMLKHLSENMNEDNNTNGHPHEDLRRRQLQESTIMPTWSKHRRQLFAGSRGAEEEKAAEGKPEEGEGEEHDTVVDHDSMGKPDDHHDVSDEDQEVHESAASEAEANAEVHGSKPSPAGDKADADQPPTEHIEGDVEDADDHAAKLDAVDKAQMEAEADTALHDSEAVANAKKEAEHETEELKSSPIPDKNAKGDAAADGAAAEERSPPVNHDLDEAVHEEGEEMTEGLEEGDKDEGDDLVHHDDDGNEIHSEEDLEDAGHTDEDHHEDELRRRLQSDDVLPDENMEMHTNEEGEHEEGEHDAALDDIKEHYDEKGNAPGMDSMDQHYDPATGDHGRVKKTNKTPEGMAAAEKEMEQAEHNELRRRRRLFEATMNGENMGGDADWSTSSSDNSFEPEAPDAGAHDMADMHNMQHLDPLAAEMEGNYDPSMSGSASGSESGEHAHDEMRRL